MLWDLLHHRDNSGKSVTLSELERKYYKNECFPSHQTLSFEMLRTYNLQKTNTHMAVVDVRKREGIAWVRKKVFY